MLIGIIYILLHYYKVLLHCYKFSIVLVFQIKLVIDKDYPKCFMQALPLSIYLSFFLPFSYLNIFLKEASLFLRIS